MSTQTSGAVRPSAAVSGLLVVGVVALFFIWGGVTSLNDILIPKLKGLFQLSYAQAMLTQFAFFTAYAVISLPAGLLVARVGYGRGIAFGLGAMALGCLMFVPAASTAAYGLFLAALFVVAGGITILQVAANPLIAELGDARTSHSRLTFAQAFNSLGTTIAPLIGARLILSSISGASHAAGPVSVAVRAREAAVIGHTYVGIAVVLTVIAILFWLGRRRFGVSSAAVGAPAAQGGGLALLKRPRLAMGVAAIFLYVGAEVSIGSMMVNYLMLPSKLGLGQQAAGEHISLYWGGAMLGRFLGSALLRMVSPGKLLLGAAATACALALVSASTTGAFAGWSLIAVGLFNSIMFPTIFSLALEGMGERTPQASGLLCMAIVGGAIVPVVGGLVADASSLPVALIVPAACYALVAAFGWAARKPAVA